MLEMNEMLKLVVERDASDLHLHVGKQAVMRIHGTLDVVDPDVLVPDDTERLMREITPPRYQQQLQEAGSADFAYAYSDMARFRVNVYRGMGNFHLVMRLIPSRILSFEELGLPQESIIEVLSAHRGMVLVVGPTGSGKTTTLATMLDWINTERYIHLVTIEDPIEYTHQHKKAIISQRELHVDTPSFAHALKVVLRQDPDVILVGEMRDPATMEAALTAAETGHLVFATLHTISASQTIDRIVDAFPVNQQEQIRTVLSVCLRTIIAQTLLPRASGKGRVAAYEILHNTPAVSNLVREKKTNRIISTIQTSSKLGMITLDDSLLNLYRKGDINGEACLERCHYISEMREKMMQITPQVDV